MSGFGAARAGSSIDKNVESSTVEQRIIQALSDPKYQFRTVQGIAKAAVLDPKIVREVLAKNVLIRKSAVPDRNGNTLYALRARPKGLKEYASEALSFMAGSPR
jgi:hypothetical protein